MLRPNGLAPALLRLSGRCEGNISVLFAISLMALIVACGAAIDYERYLSSGSALQTAVDAAALQVSARDSTDQTDMMTLAQTVLQDTYATTGFGEIGDTQLTIDGNTVTLSAEAQLPSTFMGLAGVSEMKVERTSEISKTSTDLEVALVIDTSSSMGTILDSVKMAAMSLAEAVVDESDSSASARVAVIPVDEAVNLGSRADDARGPITSGTCLAVGCEYYKAQNYWGNYKIYNSTTCVTERTGDHAYTDDPVSKGYVGYFYLPSNRSRCPNVMLPLTDDLDAIKSTIDGLSATGQSAGHIGLAWGWYSLSPDFGFWTGDSIPDSYGTISQKVMVILTDGEFNLQYCSGIYAMDTNAGSSVKANCSSLNGSSMSQAAKLCTAIKEKGIVIYTIGYNLTNGSTMEDMLSTCASGESYAFLPETTSELESVFKQIAEQLTVVRVSQ
jgi:Flp pilus assembly protein TadG